MLFLFCAALLPLGTPSSADAQQICSRTRISNGQTIDGVLSETDCAASANAYRDRYFFDGRPGQIIVIYMNSSAVDSLLVLKNPDGLIIASDDNSGGGLNARIPSTSMPVPTFSLSSWGTYVIEATTTASPTTGAYTILMTSNFDITPPRRQSDFDGDHKTDLSIFRPSAGEWWVNRSSDGATFAVPFGSGSDIITPGDFTGDGQSDAAFFRPANGFFCEAKTELIILSSSEPAATFPRSAIMTATPSTTRPFSDRPIRPGRCRGRVISSAL